MLVHPQSRLHRDPNLLLPFEKPIGPVRVDRNHWAGENLIGSWIFAEPHQSKVFTDLAGNADGVVVGQVAHDIGPYGSQVAATRDNQSDRIAIGNISTNNPLIIRDNRISILVYAQAGSSSPVGGSHGNSYPRFIDKSTAGFGADGFTFYPFCTSTETRGLFFNFGSSSKQLNVDPLPAPLAVNTWNFFGVSIDTTTTAGRVIHVNGEQLTPTVSSTGTIAQIATDAALLNWNHSSDRQYRKPVVFIHVWNDVLSLSEHRDLCDKPFQFLVPA